MPDTTRATPVLPRNSVLVSGFAVLLLRILQRPAFGARSVPVPITPETV
ncbi:hypothetical protein [Nocardia altamirensis]|nr:hypothetical protein [Nocardia altamirensis]